jgi:hypothetical protein
MSDAAIPTRANQPIDASWAFGDEYIVDIALAVTYTNDMRLRAMAFERRQMFKAFEPLDAFLIANGALLTRVPFAELILTLPAETAPTGP